MAKKYKSSKKKIYVSKFDPKFKNLIYDKNKVDVIFNALHGRDGEDGIAQTYFEYLKIPYTHSGVISSYNAMNKIISKKIFIKSKILTPKYLILKKNGLKMNNILQLLKKNKMGFPIVIKPISEGSSLGVKINKNLIDLKKSITSLFRKYEEIMLEQYIGGQEVQAAVLNNVPLGAIELIPKRSFYDYKAKYTKSAKTEHVMQQDLEKISTMKF